MSDTLAGKAQPPEDVSRDTERRMAESVAHFLYWSGWLEAGDVLEVAIENAGGRRIQCGYKTFERLQERLTELYPDWRSWNSNYVKGQSYDGRLAECPTCTHPQVVPPEDAVRSRRIDEIRAQVEKYRFADGGSVSLAMYCDDVSALLDAARAELKSQADAILHELDKAVAAERAACAEIAEELGDGTSSEGFNVAVREYRKRIEARGGQDAQTQADSQ